MNEILNKTSPLVKFGSMIVAIMLFVGGITTTVAIQDGRIKVNADNIQANKVAFDTRLDKFEIRYEQDSIKTTARMDKDKQELMNYIDKMETRLIYRLDRTDKKIDQLSVLMKGSK